MDGEFKLKSYTKLVKKEKHCLTNFPLNFSAVNFPFPPNSFSSILIWELFVVRKLFVTQKITLDRGKRVLYYDCVATIAHVCGPVYGVSCLYHVLWSMRVVINIFDPPCCCFGKNSGHLYLERNSRKPGLAGPETLKFGRSKWIKLWQYVCSWLFGFTTGSINVKVLSFRRLFTRKIMPSNWAS